MKFRDGGAAGILKGILRLLSRQISIRINPLAVAPDFVVEVSAL